MLSPLHQQVVRDLGELDEIKLPLQEIFRTLPPDALKISTPQQPVEVNQEIRTPFLELARQDQALVDLSHSGAVAVSLVHCPTENHEAALVRKLAQRARSQGFATAQVSLLEASLDTFEQLVRLIIENLFAPGATRAGGLLQLLDRYFERRGTRAAQRFSEATTEAGAHGDLTALCLAYLESDDEARAELRAYQAWLDGTEPGRNSRNPNVRAALNAHTAHRALGELSRTAQVLGGTGLAIYLHDGAAVAKRTSRSGNGSSATPASAARSFSPSAAKRSRRAFFSGFWSSQASNSSRSSAGNSPSSQRWMS